MKKISVCIITKNEERNIARVLGSVSPFAPEIIVVDTGSTDRTVDIARLFDASVYFEPWGYDFSAARNVAISYATGDWILSLDADDYVPEKSAEKIVELCERENVFYGISVLSVNILPIGYIGKLNSIQAKLFPRNDKIRYKNRIHEEAYSSAVEAGFEFVKRPDVVIEHLGYSDFNTVKQKEKRNIILHLIDAGIPQESNFETAEIRNYVVVSAGGIQTVWSNLVNIGYTIFSEKKDCPPDLVAAEAVIKRYEDIGSIDALNDEILRISAAPVSGVERKA